MSHNHDHILSVKMGPYFDPEESEYNLDIECSANHSRGAECNSWVRCETCRRSINALVSMGRDDEVIDMEDKAENGTFIHGEPHMMIEYDICTESDVCVLLTNDSWEANAQEAVQEYGPGKYYVDFECDGYSVDVFDFERVEND